MKIILATGIYPPDIGGPATYVRHLAEELTVRGEEVIVVTFMKTQDSKGRSQENEKWKVVTVSPAGGPLIRWRKFAQVLKQHGTDADIVYCFSSVSAGVPLRLARLKKPKKLLRLGGDFPWERYTDLGGRKTLKQFLASALRLRSAMGSILRGFHHVVFSTHFQQELYELMYAHLPSHAVIENALPARDIVRHQRHDPLRLLYLGRFVKFKNLENLVRAVAKIPHATLTLVGSGPMGTRLSALSRSLMLQGRVSVVPPVHGDGVTRVFVEHDVLVIPSITEISPNVALEARACGLPVMLTEENGLSPELRSGMVIRRLITVNDITKAILEADQHYEEFATNAAEPFVRRRGWEEVAGEHVKLFKTL
ncbi:MAG: glycosyltransferase family 4 protein [Candidatus Peribacteraceae bacterium]|nr:glycosyltransferase family 4 protein [Candidatus Peribacteraceae bacterium]